MVTIRREAKKKDVMIKYVTKERLDQMSETGKHQGVIAYAAAYEYAEVSDILEKAKEKGEDPFIFILDNIEEPGSRTDCDRCEGICRCTELHAGCKGDKPFPDDRRAEKRRALVCLCGYGW